MIQDLYSLTHWGRVKYIYASLNWVIIGSDNGLSPVRRQAIIWTKAGILLIWPLGTNFSEILIGIQTFSFKKLHLKTSSAKWRLFCLCLNELSSKASYHKISRSLEVMRYKFRIFQSLWNLIGIAAGLLRYLSNFRVLWSLLFITRTILLPNWVNCVWKSLFIISNPLHHSVLDIVHQLYRCYPWGLSVFIMTHCFHT